MSGQLAFTGRNNSQQPRKAQQGTQGWMQA
jgi:hypothetical protein